MDVNYEYYKIFYYVAKYNSFTKAANVLGNSQPNITRAMNCLEHEVHCTLFIRNNRGVKLTPEGEQLYRYVSSAMTQLRTAEEKLASGIGLEHGSISIGASETALNIYLLNHLKKFHMTYPGIRLKIHNHSTPQAVSAVENGEIDFAVVTTPTNAKAPLTEIKLKAFQEILIGGKTFTALGSQVLSLAELKNYPLICLGRETMTYQFYHQLFLSHGIELMPDTEAATTDQILPLVKSELGLAFLPSQMAEEALKKGEIVSIQTKETIPKREICMVYDKQHPLSIAAQKLKNIIISTFPSA
ncbi:LysR family transcriptional regulator [uncultured Eubacterium sp.]|uniref:LysR family transcriptional regulator n=1 Tax=uncultured Eubacterium sp. TaxID=165185 RepID=UPI002596B681|nr:LysR family transcriptional regulator [uncultured Eubacterium sp.]